MLSFDAMTACRLFICFLLQMLSFDAMMAAPQGRPVAVRMTRDAAVRAPQQPLVTFFRSALGLSVDNSKCARILVTTVHVDL